MVVLVEEYSGKRGDVMALVASVEPHGNGHLINSNELDTVPVEGLGDLDESIRLPLEDVIEARRETKSRMLDR